MTRRPSYLTASIARFNEADTRIQWPHERARRAFWWLVLLCLVVIGLALSFVLHKEAEAGRELERIHRITPEIRESAPELRFEW